MSPGQDGAAPASDAQEQTSWTAPMNGTVVAWLAQDGEEVTEGHPVLVVETMKMETP
ncbi:acetyl-CoA carboxylase biotin carboxyl carrier protein subunit [Kocuria rhizophila]|nr:acetyl-CoA carboxylase biotin carboxyl carrier protein subunit [Kocuria rhizophila]